MLVQQGRVFANDASGAVAAIREKHGAGEGGFMMPKCAIEPNQIPVYCEVYNCSNRAEYTIGNPQGPKSRKMNVCESCMQGLADSIPEEFLPSREDPEPVTAEKLYTCDYCGQVVGTTSTAKASHVRLCLENPKNKGKTKAGGGK